MNLQQKLEMLQTEALEKIDQVNSIDELEDIRVTYMGKKGKVTGVLKGMKDLTPEERPVVGKTANIVSGKIKKAVEKTKVDVDESEMRAQLEGERFDVTLAGRSIGPSQGHVIVQIMESIEDLFLGIGCKIVYGTEIETEQYNFERVNVPQDHPARDMQ